MSALLGGLPHNSCGTTRALALSFPMVSSLCGGGPASLPGPLGGGLGLHLRIDALRCDLAAPGGGPPACPVVPGPGLADLLGHDRLDLVGQLRDRLGPRHGGVVVLDRELLRDSAGADRAVRQTPALRFPRVWIRPGNRLELRDEEVVGALEFPVLAFQPGVQLLLSPLVIAEIACHGPIKGPQDAETLVDPGVQLVGWSTRG